MKKSVYIILSAVFVLAACGDSKKETNTQSVESAPVQITVPDDIQALLGKHTCVTCHTAAEKLVGPAYTEIAKKGYSDEEMVHLMFNPTPENWPGYSKMLTPAGLTQEDALTIAKWINSLK